MADPFIQDQESGNLLTPSLPPRCRRRSWRSA
jgi:hypothetical protein